jgi:hypothetical protein
LIPAGDRDLRSISQVIAAEIGKKGAGRGKVCGLKLTIYK